MARKLPIVYSPVTEIDCKPYRCKLSARSCAARFEKAHEPMSLIEMRKGVHLRGPDLRGCVGCEVGAYASRRLKKLAEEKAAADEPDGDVSSKPRRWVKPVLPG